MKTLLSTAALAALLVSGVALADGPGMSASKGLSDPQSHMQNSDGRHMGKGKHDGEERRAADGRNNHDEDHRGEDHRGEDHRGEGQHQGKNHAGANDDDDDDRGERHMKHMDRDHS